MLPAHLRMSRALYRYECREGFWGPLHRGPTMALKGCGMLPIVCAKCWNATSLYAVNRGADSSLLLLSQFAPSFSPPPPYSPCSG